VVRLPVTSVMPADRAASWIEFECHPKYPVQSNAVPASS
jgi:hypothetical protein